jgi:hypothetical protein
MCQDDPKYAPYVEQFAGITNQEIRADAKKLQIDGELQDSRTLAAAGGMGVIAQMAAGVVDLPTIYFPLVGRSSVAARRPRALRVASLSVRALTLLSRKVRCRPPRPQGRPRRAL